MNQNSIPEEHKSQSRTLESGLNNDIVNTDRNENISTARKRATNALLMQTRQLIPNGFANCAKCGAIVFKVSLY